MRIIEALLPSLVLGASSVVAFTFTDRLNWHKIGTFAFLCTAAMFWSMIHIGFDQEASPLMILGIMVVMFLANIVTFAGGIPLGLLVIGAFNSGRRRNGHK